jgi:hypothetical protein
MRLLLGSGWTLIAGSIASGGHLRAWIMRLSDNVIFDFLGPGLVYMYQ